MIFDTIVYANIRDKQRPPRQVPLYVCNGWQAAHDFVKSAEIDKDVVFLSVQGMSTELANLPMMTFRVPWFFVDFWAYMVTVVNEE